MDINTDSESIGKARKRQKTLNHEYNLKLNNSFIDCIDVLSEAFCKGKDFELRNEAEVISQPFTCCVLQNFIQPDAYLKELEEELFQLNFQTKVNDLYQFKQSKDLGDSSLLHISKFKEFLKGDVLTWLKNITKIPLTDKIDISCSSYTYTDHLLCHDDELEGRRIAFIFYLVPEWTEEDGGSLDLFNTVDGQPSKICKSIIPKWNNFVFFKVSPISFHQVSEVLTSKKRIALSGWFNGPSLEPSISMKETSLFQEPSQDEIDITEWINPVYLDGQTQLDIRDAFEENSEVLLPDFFQTTKFEEVCKALNDNNIVWHIKGPSNRRNIIEASDYSNLPPVLKACQTLLTSEAFLIILSNLTALILHPTCEEGAKLGKVFSCIRKWSHQSYTLLHDQSFSQIFSLNAFVFFNCSDWDSEYGGYSSYVAIEENDELLRIEPMPNSLALVYVTEGTSHFVKYVNSRVKENVSPFFHDIFCMYIEDDDNKTEK